MKNYLVSVLYIVRNKQFEGYFKIAYQSRNNPQIFLEKSNKYLQGASLT
jgi:hypothetical protein